VLSLFKRADVQRAGVLDLQAVMSLLRDLHRNAVLGTPAGAGMGAVMGEGGLISEPSRTASSAAVSRQQRSGSELVSWQDSAGEERSSSCSGDARFLSSSIGDARFLSSSSGDPRSSSELKVGDFADHLDDNDDDDDDDDDDNGSFIRQSRQSRSAKEIASVIGQGILQRSLSVAPALNAASAQHGAQLGVQQAKHAAQPQQAASGVASSAAAPAAAAAPPPSKSARSSSIHSSSIHSSSIETTSSIEEHLVHAAQSSMASRDELFFIPKEELKLIFETFISFDREMEGLLDEVSFVRLWPALRARAREGVHSVNGRNHRFPIACILLPVVPAQSPDELKSLFRLADKTEGVGGNTAGVGKLDVNEVVCAMIDAAEKVFATKALSVVQETQVGASPAGEGIPGGVKEAPWMASEYRGRPLMTSDDL
jgi:hypothetical protein